MLKNLKSDSSDSKKEEEIIPDPAMTIGPISSSGELSIDFNQDMIVPDTINVNVYKSVITFPIRSDTDGTLTYGRFRKSE